MEATAGADLLRTAFLIVAALYAGIAFAVLRRYFTSPPRSRLRRFHVIGVATGTTVLVAAQAGGIYDRFGEELPWYGAPAGLVGVAILVASLGCLFAAESRIRRGIIPDATDQPLTIISDADAGPGQRAAEAAERAFAESHAGDDARATRAADSARAASLAREARATEAAAAAELARSAEAARAAADARRARRARRSEEGQEAEEGQGADAGDE